MSARISRTISRLRESISQGDATSGTPSITPIVAGAAVPPAPVQLAPSSRL